MLRRSNSSSRLTAGGAPMATPTQQRSGRRRSVGGPALPANTARQIVEQLKGEEMLAFRIDDFLSLAA